MRSWIICLVSAILYVRSMLGLDTCIHLILQYLFFLFQFSESNVNESSQVEVSGNWSHLVIRRGHFGVASSHSWGVSKRHPLGSTSLLPWGQLVWQRHLHECKGHVCTPRFTQFNRLQSSFLTVHGSLDPHSCIGFLYKEVGIHFHCILTHFYSFSTNIYRGNVFVSSFQEYSQKVLQYLPRKLDPDPAKQLSMCLKSQTIPVTDAVCQNQDIFLLSWLFILWLSNYQGKLSESSGTG